MLGHIFVVWTALAKPQPKDKIVLCVCDKIPLFLWVNTNPSFHGVGQFALFQDDHDALDRDCHLDCSQVKTFPPNDWASARDRGRITRELARRLLAFLSAGQPKTLTTRHYNLILANLRLLS